MAHHLILQIKFHWNTAMPIHLCIMCGYLNTPIAQVNSCDRDCLATKSEHIYYIHFYTQNLLTLGLAHWGGIEIQATTKREKQVLGYFPEPSFLEPNYFWKLTKCWHIIDILSVEIITGNIKMKTLNGQHFKICLKSIQWI